MCFYKGAEGDWILEEGSEMDMMGPLSTRKKPRPGVDSHARLDLHFWALELYERLSMQL